MRGWIIRIAVIGAIALGAFIFRDRLSGNAAELALGDCFDVPPGETDISDVQHHPCTEAHTGEVFAVLTHTAAKGEAPPARESLFTFLTTQCGTAFTSYTGLNVETQEVLDYGAFYPSDKDWNDGDRRITCYAYRIDEGPMSTSVKKSP
jgi:Septum formation